MTQNRLLEKLRLFGQEHLLAFWDELSEAERGDLAAQIDALDLSRIATLYEHRDDPVVSGDLANRAVDPPGYQFSTVTDPRPIRNHRPIRTQDAILAGNEALRKGKVAAMLVAGGQGTRLGFPHPKGMYPIGPVSEATLFRIHFEKVLAASRHAGRRIPYCIMTSPATHADTVEYLEQNAFFGLESDDVFVFRQGTMPAVALSDGKILLDRKGGIAQSPDGHGGMLAAIAKRDGSPSILDRLRQRGIEYLFYHQVDNPLVRICSPEFLGYHILSDSELTSQVIRKRGPADRVGNVVEVDGRLHVIEYSDLPALAGKQTHPDGSLRIWAGSIAVHVFDAGLLERNADVSTSLPFHIARKKVPFIDPNTGHREQPERENAVKFERFIFDLLPSAKNAIVVEVDIPNHYAPVKNAPGSASDCPETVRRRMSELHADWLRKAGAVVAPETPVEISPLFADSPEELAGKIRPGTLFDGQAYLA